MKTTTNKQTQKHPNLVFLDLLEDFEPPGLRDPRTTPWFGFESSASDTGLPIGNGFTIYMFVKTSK